MAFALKLPTFVIVRALMGEVPPTTSEKVKAPEPVLKLKLPGPLTVLEKVIG